MYRVELRARVEDTRLALSQGRLDDAEELSVTLLEDAQSWLEAERCAAQVNRAQVLFARGRVAEAARLAQEVVAARDNPRNRRRHEVQLLMAWAVLGQVALREHDPAAAREPLSLAYDGFVHHRMWAEAATTLEDRLRAELMRGDHLMASQMARLKALTHEDEGRPELAAPAWTLSGTEAVEGGDLLDAQDALLRAVAIYAERPVVRDTVVCLAELAVALHLSERAEEAAAFWSEVQRALPLIADPSERARAALVLGMAANRMQRHAEASSFLRAPAGGTLLEPAEEALRRRHLGEALVHTGHADAARVELRAGVDGLESTGQEAAVGTARVLLVLLGG